MFPAEEKHLKLAWFPGIILVGLTDFRKVSLSAWPGFPVFFPEGLSCFFLCFSHNFELYRAACHNELLKCVSLISVRIKDSESAKYANCLALELACMLFFIAPLTTLSTLTLLLASPPLSCTFDPSQLQLNSLWFGAWQGHGNGVKVWNWEKAVLSVRGRMALEMEWSGKSGRQHGT